MIKDALPCELRGFLLAMFQYEIVWKPIGDEEPPF